MNHGRITRKKKSSAENISFLSFRVSQARPTVPALVGFAFFHVLFDLSRLQKPVTYSLHD